MAIPPIRTAAEEEMSVARAKVFQISSPVCPAAPAVDGHSRDRTIRTRTVALRQFLPSPPKQRARRKREGKNNSRRGLVTKLHILQGRIGWYVQPA